MTGEWLRFDHQTPNCLLRSPVPHHLHLHTLTTNAITQFTIFNIHSVTFASITIFLSNNTPTIILSNLSLYKKPYNKRHQTEKVRYLPIHYVNASAMDPPSAPSSLHLPLSQSVTPTHSSCADQLTLAFAPIPSPPSTPIPTTWTPTQEARLLYVRFQLKEAQKRWSAGQDLWLKEVSAL